MCFHCGRGLLKRFQTSLSVARVATDQKLWLCQRFTQQHTESAAFWKFSWETQPDGAELRHERRCQPFPKPQEGQLIQRPELVKNCRFFFSPENVINLKKKNQNISAWFGKSTEHYTFLNLLVSCSPAPTQPGLPFHRGFFPSVFYTGRMLSVWRRKVTVGTTSHLTFCSCLLNCLLQGE